ncbi:hypothetical protein ACN9MZ_00530 [Pseudoduganella sp. S-14]|uniref:hypothetical protein n=1 Tax=Pseudoduganella sp. S-14 TaxID=3404065 RepID=UPI003CF748DA
MPLTIARPRYGWLALVAVLHLALFACWRFSARLTVPRLPQREGEIVFLTQAPAMPGMPARTERPRMPAAVTQPRRSAVASTKPAAVLTVPPAAPAPGTTAPDPFAQPAPVVESVLERSRRAAIGVDRELRKESKNDNDRVLAHEPKLAQDIALAYKGSGAFAMAETVLPNGDTLARVTTPFTSYCILKRGNRSGAGLNAIDNAGKTLIVSCPK